MDILQTATDWAKAEVLATRFFIVFAILFLIASAGFWQLGKTDLARAYIIPTLVAGILLMNIGVGLVYTNMTRVKQFEAAYKEDTSAFVDSELARAEATLKEYKNVVFTAIPLIIAACALGLFFIHSPNWRASLIIAISMLIVILLIDGTAHARIESYNEKLEMAER